MRQFLLVNSIKQKGKLWPSLPDKMGLFKCHLHDVAEAIHQTVWVPVRWHWKSLHAHTFPKSTSLTVSPIICNFPTLTNRHSGHEGASWLELRKKADIVSLFQALFLFFIRHYLWHFTVLEWQYYLLYLNVFMCCTSLRMSPCLKLM